MLTDEQISHFYTFGFVVLRGIFSVEEIDKLRESSLNTMESLRDSADYIDTHNQSIQPWLERDSAMENLVDDDRIYGIGEVLCGNDFWLDGTEGHLRVGDTDWHGGDASFPTDLPWIKIAIYLDPLTKDDGCLRVIPGTHVLMDPDPYVSLRGPSTETYFGVSPDQIPSVSLETNPGDVIIFTEQLIHGAFGGGVGRHQICVNFVGDLKSDEQVNFVRNFYQKTNSSVRPTRTYVNSDRPRIRKMVQTPLKLGFEVIEV